MEVEWATLGPQKESMKSKTKAGFFEVGGVEFVGVGRLRMWCGARPLVKERK